MIRTGLWIELEAAIGFIVGLGLGSLTGQRTISVILMIVLEVILTPIFLRAHIPYMINLQRSIVGVATDHLGPSSIPIAGGGGQSVQANLISETRAWAAIVVAAWVVVWTALGAWRMSTRHVGRYLVVDSSPSAYEPILRAPNPRLRRAE